MLPNFLIIGAMKAGTTSLYEYLRRHPGVYMPKAKELNFFVAERNWNRGRGWYERQFDGARGELAIGEATTHYTRYPHFGGVPERIAALIPDVRLIYVLRHPIERIRSEYVYRRVGGWESRPLDQAVTSDPTYLDGSRYAMQIERYTEHFGREQLLITTAERLRDDRVATMRLILSFLGVDPGWRDTVLEHQFHKSADQRLPGRLGFALRRLPGYDALASVAPDRIKNLYRRTTTRQIDERESGLDRDLERRLTEELREDMLELRRYLGSEFHCWGLAERTSS